MSNSNEPKKISYDLMCSGKDETSYTKWCYSIPVEIAKTLTTKEKRQVAFNSGKFMRKKYDPKSGACKDVTTAYVVDRSHKELAAGDRSHFSHRE